MNYLFAAILIASLTSTSVFAACPVNVGRGAKYCENGYWWKCENCAGVDCGILQAGDGACFSGEWRGYATFGSGRFNYEWSIRQHGPGPMAPLRYPELMEVRGAAIDLTVPYKVNGYLFEERRGSPQMLVLGALLRASCAFRGREAGSSSAGVGVRIQWRVGVHRAAAAKFIC